MAQEKKKGLTDEQLIEKYGHTELKEDFGEILKRIVSVPKPKKKDKKK